jgi:hypothetical protein
MNFWPSDPWSEWIFFKIVISIDYLSISIYFSSLFKGMYKGVRNLKACSPLSRYSCTNYISMLLKVRKTLRELWIVYFFIMGFSEARQSSGSIILSPFMLYTLISVFGLTSTQPVSLEIILTSSFSLGSSLMLLELNL